MRPSSCMKPINYGAINDATVAAGSISIIDQRAAGHRTRLRNDVVCPVSQSTTAPTVGPPTAILASIDVHIPTAVAGETLNSLPA